MMRTTITLEIIGDTPTWEQFEEAIQSLRAVPGVISTMIRRNSNRASMGSLHWATVDVELLGTDKVVLRKIYQAVSHGATVSPLRLNGRSCSLNDLFDDTS
jgi:hypothetical protein